MFAKFFASFRRRTNAQLIAIQIAEVEKAALENQATADHYQALADGGNRTLARLRALQPPVVPTTTARAPRASKLPVGVTEAPTAKAIAAKTLRRVG